MYQLKEIMPYLEKEILCKKNINNFIAGEFYKVDAIWDMDTSLFIESIEHSTETIIYDIAMCLQDLEYPIDPSNPVFEFIVNENEGDETDSGFSEHFELVTHVELRQRKIKSILQ